MTRKYHGQGLPERVFKKQLYSPRFNVVAGGAANGRRELWGGLYTGVERRLDTVIFRSLWATSINQARQMVIHGHVEVNGKKEHRPGLLLRPGDIYHANPQLVKRFISSHFHEHSESLAEGRRKAQSLLREIFLKKRGKTLQGVKPIRPPEQHLFEFNPYTPVALQGSSPIFQLLDDEARREERLYQVRDRFIPKPFMTPNIYLPSYLEVSYRSCTGCFVRLPHIKRDGLMEIPSPFPPEVHENAGMFYTQYGRGVYRRQRGYRGYRLFWSKNKQKH